MGKRTAFEVTASSKDGDQATHIYLIGYAMQTGGWVHRPAACFFIAIELFI